VAGEPHLHPASGVLRNQLGITAAAELARAEAALSASRLIDLERRRLLGRYDLKRSRTCATCPAQTRQGPGIAEECPVLVISELCGSTVWQHSPSPQISHDKRHSLLEGRVGDTST